MKKKSEGQPDWVCYGCALIWGNWWVDGEYVGPTSHCATCHEGICNVCKQIKVVTEARDYGYLREGWSKQINEALLPSP